MSDADSVVSDGKASVASDDGVVSDDAAASDDASDDGAASGDASDDDASDDASDDGAAVPTASSHDWPGPPWGKGTQVPPPRPWVEEREVPRDERRFPDTMSMFEFARLVGVEAEHDRTSDDAVLGAMRKVLSGRSALTIRRVRREVPPVFGPDGALKTRGYRLVEVWQARELHYPHASAERA